MHLTIQINEENGLWTAETLEAPGIVGQADTPRGAVDRLLDALEDSADERIWSDLLTRRMHILEQLADKAEIEIKAGRLTELDPDLL